MEAKINIFHPNAHIHFLRHLFVDLVVYFSLRFSFIFFRFLLYSIFFVVTKQWHGLWFTIHSSNYFFKVDIKTEKILHLYKSANFFLKSLKSEDFFPASMERTNSSLLTLSFMEVIFSLVAIGIFSTQMTEEKIWAVSFQV